MKLIGSLLRITAALSLAIAFAATIISVSVKDRWLWSALPFYAAPWLLRALAAIFALGFFGRKKFVWLIALICLGTSGWQAWQSFRKDPLPGPAPKSTVAVSFWNAAHELCERPNLWRDQDGADLVGLVETGNFTAEQFKAFQKINPSHQWKILDNGTMIGVRGKIISQEYLGVSGHFRCHKLRVALTGHGDLNVILIDIRSDPTQLRGPSLARILAAAADDPRTVIFGDFNTPVESMWFDAWRESGMTLANDGARQGFRETWAFGAPLMTLDQIWLGKKWRAVSARQSRPAFDHDRLDVVIGPR